MDSPFPSKAKELSLVNHRSKSQIETQVSHRSFLMSAAEPILSQNKNDITIEALITIYFLDGNSHHRKVKNTWNRSSFI